MSETRSTVNDRSSAPTGSVSDDPVSCLVRERLLEPPRHPGLVAHLDRFEILDKLGEGGMGIVLLASDPESTHRVAIKVMRPDLVGDARVVRRFLSEARHMQRLAHPNIVPVLEVADRRAGPYFVMPYMDRGSLSKVIRRSDVADPASALRIARQIAGALGHAHRKGIIHRDLKPANVLMDSAERVYLSDFGLVRDFSINESNLGLVPLEGTIAYMSPAAANGEVEDTRGDIYCFGATLYELLTGRPPFQGRSAQEVLAHVRAGPPVPILHLNPRASPGLCTVVEGAMARRLRDRYASMDEVVADLDRIEHGQTALGPPGLQAPPRTRMRTTIGVAILLLALAAVAQWGLTRGGNVVRRAEHPDDGNGAAALANPVSSFPLGTEIHTDNFDSSLINDSVWKWGQKDHSDKGLDQKNHAQISQLNGSMLLDVRTESQRHGFSRRDAWVVSAVDLKGRGDIRIDLELSGRAVIGTLAILLSDLSDSNADPGALRLFEARGDTNHPIALATQALVIILSESAQSAVVSADNGRRLALYDISKLKHWHLRFFVSAHSFAGLPSDAVQLRLQRVRAARIAGPTIVVGRVTDAVTGRPVLGIAMTSEHGEPYLTAGEGMYMIPIEPHTRQHIRAEAEGYEPAEPIAIFDARPGQQVRIDVAMRKVEIGYGDVRLSVPCPRPEVRAFSMAPTHIQFAAFEGNQTQLFRMNHDGGELKALGPLPTTSGLAHIDGALYCVTNWPGRLYRITDRGKVRIIRRLRTDWPSGLALEGSRLWYIEASAIDNRFRVHAVERDSGDPIGHFVSSDIHIRGLAWGRGRLWIASLAGVVYEVDPNKALRAGRLEAGIIRRFPGSYSRLSFLDGYLWGLDDEAERFCKIRVDD